MAHQLERLADELRKAMREFPNDAGLTVKLLQAIALEVEKTRDDGFTIDGKTELAKLRAELIPVKTIHLWEGKSLLKLCSLIAGHIQLACHSYGDPASVAGPRDFKFMASPELREIVARDYRELTMVLFPGKAWKSCVVMAGSILEALLHDALTATAAIEARAVGSKSAPKNRQGVIIPLADGWKLKDLINVATELGILPAARATAIDQVLRDFRNLIHPSKEIRTKLSCTDAEAMMAKGNLDMVYAHLAS